MKTCGSFSFRARLCSFRYAFSGLVRFFFEEHIAILHLLAAVTVGILIFFFQIRGAELLALVIVTGGVWITGLINPLDNWYAWGMTGTYALFMTLLYLSLKKMGDTFRI